MLRNALESATSMKNVFFVHPLINRIGELTTQLFMLKYLFPPREYILNVITHDPARIDGVNKAAFDVATRGTNLIFSDDPSLLWRCYHNQTNGVFDTDNGINVLLSTLDLTGMFWEKYSPEKAEFFFLNETEKQKGKLLEKAFGIPDGAEIVTIHIRDGAYFGHDHNDYRNTVAETYYQTIDYLISKGYYIVKLGDTKSTQVKKFDKHFVDAAFHNAYCHLVEPYFSARSAFHIGTASGGSDLAHSFGVPCLMTNMLVIGHNAAYGNSLYTFKKYRSRPLNRFLTYEEILSSCLVDFCKANHFEAAQIELVDNSPDEIQSAAEEMIARLSGNYVTAKAAEDTYSHIKQIELKADRYRRQNRITSPTYVPLYSLSQSKDIISCEFMKMNPFFAGHIMPKQIKFDWEPEYAY
jgi:putative glycosyltransferase (TIGR04372 family)